MPAAFVTALSCLLVGQGEAVHPPPRRGYHSSPHPWKTRPPLVLPAPNGSSVRAWNTEQAAAAEQDDFVIYMHEWQYGGTMLGPYGQYHLIQIIRRLPCVPFPVILQAFDDPQTMANRRQVVVQALLAAGITDADLRVRIDYPQAEGLQAVDVEQISRTFGRLRGEAYGGGGQFLPGGGLGTGSFGGIGGAGGFRGNLRGGFGGGIFGY